MNKIMYLWESLVLRQELNKYRNYFMDVNLQLILGYKINFVLQNE